MGIEIERKYLVAGEGWRTDVTGLACQQGYLSISNDVAVRVRILGDIASITVKGMGALLSRPEFEYPIPVDDAREMLAKHCLKPIVEKKRYHIIHAGNKWDVDEFLGPNTGLVLAEIELANEKQVVELPEWIGNEVTEDTRYIEINLGIVTYGELQER